MKNSRWTKIGLSGITVIGVLALASILYASSGGGHGEAGGPLGVPMEKWWDLLWRALNFAGLVIILVWALKKPLTSGLKGRQQSISEQFEELEARKAEAEQAYKEYEAKLSRIDEEVNSIIEAAVKQGEAEKDRIIADAERAAGDIKRQAEMAVQHETAQAKANLRSEIAEQAVLVAEELIKKNLQADDQNKMVEDYLDKVGTIQ